MCKECNGVGFKYEAFLGVSGGYVQCPSCNPQAPDPDWLEPQGQSSLHPVLKDSDNGQLEV